MDNIPKIYVAATRQNDGKTTTALGLLNTIREVYPKIGYIKPVGQQVRLIGEYEVDKDATLMNEVFHIGNRLHDMSPVAIPRGFTEDYILHGNVKTLQEEILESYNRASHYKDFMILEGTGHAGVGSVIDLSNAAVAHLLDSKVIIVTCAGIGRPIDEVMLNKAVFDSFGVDVVGAIINKVIPEKYDKINKFVRLGFERKGIDVLGVVPFCSLLSSPTMRQLLEDVSGELICGEKNLDHNVSKIIVGAMPPHTALDYFQGNVLLITPGNREDLILAAVACSSGISEDCCCVRGIVLTGGIWPNTTILKLVKETGIPVILVNGDTYSVAEKIMKLIIKIRPEDTEKIEKVKELVKEYVDIDLLLNKLE
jgi:BioD-like phosphotransacetylase family protein